MSQKSFICQIVFVVLSLLNVHSRAFETGFEQSFSFVNDVNLYELKLAATQSSIGYRIAGNIKVGAVYGDSDNGFLLRFELINPKLYVEKFKVSPIQYEEKSSILDKHSKITSYAYWRNGIIEKAFIQDTKDTSINNFVRSILSLFQFQLKDTEQSETDISGTCNVKYISKSSTKFAKVKTECSSDFEVSERHDVPLGSEVRYTRVNHITTSADDGALSSIHSSDHHAFIVNAYPNVGFKVGSLFYLKAEGQLKECDVFKLEGDLNSIKLVLPDYKETDLSAENYSNVMEMNLVKLVKEQKENLKNEDVGKEMSAIAILKLLEAGRVTKTDEFIRILNARSTQDIKNQLLDLLAAIQTDESHRAFKENFNYTNEEDFESIERYLQSLSVGIRPHESVIRDLMEAVTNENIDNEKLRDTLVQTISSMTHKFAIASSNDYTTSDVIKEVQTFLTDAIDKCTEDNDCKIIYIRGLLNLQSPSTLTHLIDLALFQPYHVSVMAMKALRQFPSSYLSGFKRDFKKILYQQSKRFDSSARTIALDILLDLNPDEDDIREYVEFLKSNDAAFEVKQYLVQKLRLLSEKCADFNRIFKNILQNEPKAYNWNYYGALKGLSTALSRKFSQAPSFNGSMLSVQEIKGGVLKRGTVDMLLHYKEEQTNLFTLGLFAGGLSSFMSSSDEEADIDEDTTATAGMELAVQGSHLRPLNFFRGQAELMGHVWSGTGSEPLTAYQGITLLQDHSQKLILNNGAVLDFKNFGSMSMDLNGKIEISLWYKNANSEVVQNIGLALLTSLSIKSPIASVSIDMSISEQIQINVASKIDFSSKTAICMNVHKPYDQPDSILTHKISSKIDIPGSKKTLRNELKLHYKIPGVSYVLNQKNNEMCALILQ